MSGGGFDGFKVRPERVSALSQTFDDQQGRPSELAGEVDGASTIDTGDTGVDGTARTAVEQLTQMLQQFGQGLGEDAQGLNSHAETYRATDADGAATIHAVARQVGGPPQPPSDPGSPQDPALVSDAQPTSGIVSQLTG
jgi:type VII secretion effector (TIGR04197 family)